MTGQDVFTYYKLDLKLLTEQLGTCTEASIYKEHVLKKAQKMIKEANRLAIKVTKALQKYKGSDPIPEQKEMEEIRGIVRRYQEILGKVEDIPTDPEEVANFVKTLEIELNDAIAAGDVEKSTCFMRDSDGQAMISSHMILGNLKENLRIITNNSASAADSKKNGLKDERIVKSKVAVGEIGALDVKVVEQFLKPSKDICRNEDGSPVILERPISFEQMGKRVTAIARSEYLPVGTEYTMTLRVRADSPFAADNAALLHQLLDLGKNNGLGQWRGSGGKGAYVYKLEKCAKPAGIYGDGWN